MGPFDIFINNLANLGLEYYNRYYGKYGGFVVDNKDPENRGRLKVQVPSIHGVNTSDEWALPSGMFSGENIGFYAVPNIGDTIWVEFESGDTRYLIWSYGWYAKEFAPDRASHNTMVLQSTEGSKIVFDDAKKKVLFSRKAGQEIEITDTEINIGTEGGAAEPVVLGNKTADLHTDTLAETSQQLDDLIIFCTTQEAAAANVPILAPLIPGYVALKASLIKIKVNIETLKNTRVKPIKSTKVKTD